MNKKTYTKFLLSISGLDNRDNDVKEYMSKFWKNTRVKQNSGLHLSDYGFEFLKKNHIRFYEIKKPKSVNMVTQLLIFLDNYITVPYYISKTGVFVTDHKTALKLSLLFFDLAKKDIKTAISRPELFS